MVSIENIDFWLVGFEFCVCEVKDWFEENWRDCVIELEVYNL